MRREVDIVIISDVHLGTYGCHAKELHKYLKSIKPKRLILNGDIIDIWQFSKRYWPKSHMKVIKDIMKFIGDGVKVDYITGNHDELLRRFAGLSMGSFRIVNKVLLDINGQKTWIFHGDVFDVTMQYAKWLCRLGAVGYDILILLNSLANYISEKMGKGKISLSKKVKSSVKSAVKFINDFENTAAAVGIENGYGLVICGHIHKPEDKIIEKNDKSIRYLNSGDWIENLTSLEYSNGKWQIFEYLKDVNTNKSDDHTLDKEELTTNELFEQLRAEFEKFRLSQHHHAEIELVE